MRKFLAILLTVLLIGTLSFAAFAKGTPESPTEAAPEDYPSPTSTPVVLIIYPDHSQVQIPVDTEVPGYTNVPLSEIEALTITGNYSVVEGEEEGTYTIIAHSDLVLTLANTPTEPSDTSPVSPPTGAAPEQNEINYWLFAAIVLVALTGIFFAAKKLNKNQ